MTLPILDLSNRGIYKGTYVFQILGISNTERVINDYAKASRLREKYFKEQGITTEFTVFYLDIIVRFWNYDCKLKLPTKATLKLSETVFETMDIIRFHMQKSAEGKDWVVIQRDNRMSIGILLCTREKSIKILGKIKAHKYQPKRYPFFYHNKYRLYGYKFYNLMKAFYDKDSISKQQQLVFDNKSND